MGTPLPTIGLPMVSATTVARQVMDGVHAQACLNSTDQHPRQGVALVRAGVEAEAWQATLTTAKYVDCNPNRCGSRFRPAPYPTGGGRARGAALNAHVSTQLVRACLCNAM